MIKKKKRVPIQAPLSHTRPNETLGNIVCHRTRLTIAPHFYLPNNVSNLFSFSICVFKIRGMFLSIFHASFSRIYSLAITIVVIFFHPTAAPRRFRVSIST